LERWAEYDRFIAACDAAEKETRQLLQVDCDLPEQPSFERLKSATESGAFAFRNDPIAGANFKRDQLKDTLGRQLSLASAMCGYAPSQLDKRRCKLENEKVDEIERELAELEELIASAEAENGAFSAAAFVCFAAQRDKREEAREKVVGLVGAADRLKVGLNVSSCAVRAREWAPGIYSTE